VFEDFSYSLSTQSGEYGLLLSEDVRRRLFAFSHGFMLPVARERR
jgi:hypothetical protein